MSLLRDILSEDRVEKLPFHNRGVFNMIVNPTPEEFYDLAEEAFENQQDYPIKLRFIEIDGILVMGDAYNCDHYSLDIHAGSYIGAEGIIHPDIEGNVWAGFVRLDKDFVADLDAVSDHGNNTEYPPILMQFIDGKIELIHQSFRFEDEEEAA